MRWIFTIVLVFCLMIGNNTFAQTKQQRAISAVLAQQQKEWNSGNIDAFMHGYWQSDSLMFIGKKGPTFGWQQTLENYKKGYADTVAMGRLNFDILRIAKQSRKVYFVVGKWHLTRSIGDVGGIFSLVFKKINGYWKIVADHTN